MPQLSHKGLLTVHFVHALAWCLFHSFGLGLILRAQSEKKFLVRHFLKHYYYPQNDHGKGAVHEAFTNWKSMYNLSMCMTYGRNADPFVMMFGTELCLRSSIDDLSGVEDLHSATRMECRKRAFTPYSRHGGSSIVFGPDVVP